MVAHQEVQQALTPPVMVVVAKVLIRFFHQLHQPAAVADQDFKALAQRVDQAAAVVGM